MVQTIGCLPINWKSMSANPSTATKGAQYLLIIQCTIFAYNAEKRQNSSQVVAKNRRS
jgi:hypothetical protein